MIPPLLQPIVTAFQRGTIDRCHLADLAAIAVVYRGQPVPLERLDATLRELNLTFRDLPDVPSAYTERGRIMTRGGALQAVKGAGPAQLLAPLLERVAQATAQLALTPPRPAAKPAPQPPKPAPGPSRPAPRPAKPAPPKSTRTSPRPPEPPVRPAPTVPAAPPWSPAQVTRTDLGPADLERLLAGPTRPPGDFFRCLAAHRLAAAERFEDLLAPAQMRGVEPHTYQTETVRRVLRQFRGRTLLADEVGLGKTIEAMLILREYQLRGQVRRALVLVPPALVGQWVGELGEKARIDARVAGDGVSWGADGVTVASMALARRNAAEVQAVAWDLVIVDEAHHLKNRTTQGFKLVDGLRSRFLLLLTATPVETDLVELYNLVTLLKPGQLSTLTDFKRRFVDPRDPTGARDVARLRGLLHEVMVRNTRASCGLSLPPRYVTTVTTSPGPDERALYDAVLAVFRAHRTTARRLADTLLLEAGSSAGAVRATAGRATTDDPFLAKGLARVRGLAERVTEPAKARALLDILAAHREKVLVFTRFRETAAEVERLARAAGVAAVFVHGGVDRAGKEEAFRRFRADVPLLVCTDVGSEGHNLQHCHVLVNYDLPWNPMVIEQRIGRLHRYGQTAPVRVYNLCAGGTAEERLLDVLDRRVHLFELVVGEMDMVLGNLVDQADLEERVLRIFATHDEDAAIGREFDTIADELAAARGQATRVQKLDEALFGQEMEA